MPSQLETDRLSDGRKRRSEDETLGERQEETQLTDTDELGALVQYPDEGTEATDHLRPSALQKTRWQHSAQSQSETYPSCLLTAIFKASAFLHSRILLLDDLVQV